MRVIVDLSTVRKILKRIPFHVVDKLHYWVYSVEKFGMREVRRVHGYHDEPLKGKRHGQRSIRLSKAYRAIYIEKMDGQIELIEVIEVSKHDY